MPLAKPLFLCGIYAGVHMICFTFSFEYVAIRLELMEGSISFLIKKNTKRQDSRRTFAYIKHRPYGTNTHTMQKILKEYKSLNVGKVNVNKHKNYKTCNHSKHFANKKLERI